MCMMLYISSNKELPVIPWCHEEDYFNLKNLEVPDNSFWERAKLAIQLKTTGSYLYSAMAHTGCGCGFAYGVNPIYDEEDQKEEEKNKRSVKLLFSFLKEHFKTGEVVELYSCVAGREGNVDYKRTSISLSDFKLGDSFELYNGELISVYL